MLSFLCFTTTSPARRTLYHHTMYLHVCVLVYTASPSLGRRYKHELLTCGFTPSFFAYLCSSCVLCSFLFYYTLLACIFVLLLAVHFPSSSSTSFHKPYGVADSVVPRPALQPPTRRCLLRRRRRLMSPPAAIATARRGPASFSPYRTFLPAAAPQPLRHPRRRLVRHATCASPSPRRVPLYRAAHIVTRLADAADDMTAAW